MGLKETEFLDEVYSCHSRDHNNGEWIQTAMSFLDESLTSKQGDHEEASSVLASSEEWSMEGLNTLAYAE